MGLRRTQDFDDKGLFVGGIAVAIGRLTKEELVCSHY